MSIHKRPIVVDIEVCICDFCHKEVKVSTRCSHCGKDVCPNCWSFSRCSQGIGEDTWMLCPECTAKSRIVDSGEEDEIEQENYVYPVDKDTGEELTLEFW